MFAFEGSFLLLKFCESLLLSMQNRNYLYFYCCYVQISKDLAIT